MGESRLDRLDSRPLFRHLFFGRHTPLGTRDTVWHTSRNRMPPPRRLQLNPAFASAHGIQQDGGRPAPTSNHQSHHAQTNKVDHALRSARRTGRLNLSSCSLTALPSAMFDLRSGIEIDLSLDSSDNPGRWQSYGEEEITNLDISDNELNNTSNGSGCGFDERIAKFASLKSLRARRCNLTDPLPWTLALSKLDNLTILDLSGNGDGIRVAMLEYLPMTIREVDWSGNAIERLTEVDVSEGDAGPAIVLPNLVSLDVSKNRLTTLPPNMEVPSLQTLRFGTNRITTIPDDLIVQCSRSLSTLEGPGNQLRAVPDLFGCRRLQVVDLCDNSLTACPGVNPSLVRLSLDDNSISSLSNLFSGAQRGSETFRSDLSELRLRGNKLSQLDDDIVRCLTKLVVVDVAQNDLTDLPRVLGYLPELRRLPLEGNALRVIRRPLASNIAALKDFLRKRGPPPPGPGYLEGPDPASSGVDADGSTPPLPSNAETKSIVQSALVGTRALDVSGKNLQRLPSDLNMELMSRSTSATAAPAATTGGNIKKLNCSKNILTTLDGWLQTLPAISSIEASQNQIDALPDCLADVPLADIRLARNRLSFTTIASSPLCLASLSSSLAMSLSYLDLSGNDLELFPSDLSKLPALSTLLLSNNRIRTLAAGGHDGKPSGWCKGFKALETLNLSGNHISDLGDLPRCLIECCPLLRGLSLQNNELCLIPPALGMLQNLTSIDLRGNPQRGIRMGILDRSCTEILAYLKGRMDEGERRSLETLMQTTTPSEGGESESGKSAPSNEKEGSNKVEELKRSIEDITMELNNVHLTEATKYAKKKQLAMTKAKLIKEERLLRMQEQS